MPSVFSWPKCLFPSSKRGGGERGREGGGGGSYAGVKTMNELLRSNASPNTPLLLSSSSSSTLHPARHNVYSVRTRKGGAFSYSKFGASRPTWPATPWSVSSLSLPLYVEGTSLTTTLATRTQLLLRLNFINQRVQDKLVIWRAVTTQTPKFVIRGS
jgi:hypothetical protein